MTLRAGWEQRTALWPPINCGAAEGREKQRPGSERKKRKPPVHSRYQRLGAMESYCTGRVPISEAFQPASELSTHRATLFETRDPVEGNRVITRLARALPGRKRGEKSRAAHAFHGEARRENQFNSRTNVRRLPRLIPDPGGSSRRGCKPENVAAKPTSHPYDPTPPFLLRYSSIYPLRLHRLAAFGDDTCCEGT